MKPLYMYGSIQKNSPGTDNRLVMGPWSHGGWSTFVDIPKAPQSAYQKATQRLYFGGARPSSITLPVQP